MLGAYLLLIYGASKFNPWHLISVQGEIPIFPIDLRTYVCNSGVGIDEIYGWLKSSTDADLHLLDVNFNNFDF